MRRRGVLADGTGPEPHCSGSAFQIFDGLVDHGLSGRARDPLRADPLRYDLAWNVPGALVFVAGLWVLLRARRDGVG